MLCSGQPQNRLDKNKKISRAPDKLSFGVITHLKLIKTQLIDLLMSYETLID